MRREWMKWVVWQAVCWGFIIVVSTPAHAFYDLLWWTKDTRSHDIGCWIDGPWGGGCWCDDTGGGVTDPPPGGDGEDDDSGHEGSE